MSWSVFGKKLKPEQPQERWTLEARPGGCWIATRGQERRRVMMAQTGAQVSASVGGKLFNGEWAEEGRAGATSSSSGGDLTAQFPGKVRKIIVTAGAQVAAGDPLVLVEAMKMEFAIQAPTAGTVTKILVSEGQQIQPGDRFVDFKEGN